MPFSLNSISRLIAYPHHQAVQSLGSTAYDLDFQTILDQLVG
jgi:hypothetical protein